ncbi:hypothetical protein DZF91_25925, partial [Actinomadura logoneensis]
MSELNGSGSRGVPGADSAWPVLGRDTTPQPDVPAQAAGPANGQGVPGQVVPGQVVHGQGPGGSSRPGAAPDAEAQPWDIVERLHQMADLIGDALSAGERKVEQSRTDAAAQVAAVQAERESAQRDAAAAWGEVQRARGQAEQADR